MKKKSKQLSNPHSTGGGGPFFEIKIQASFAALMLVEGFVPCLPCFPIKKIKLQGKFKDYDTDDLIVFTEQIETGETRKLLGQIKESVKITEGDKEFGEVIQAAWNDFNDIRLFARNKDSLALITGSLSAVDIKDGRTILDWAKTSENAEEFHTKVGLAQFSNDGKKAKLQAFKYQLNSANNDKQVSNEDTFQFLRHFYILSYDLDIRSGVVLSLLHSLIGPYTVDSAESMWARLLYEMHIVNQEAGTITREYLINNLVTSFREPAHKTIPAEFSKSQLPTAKADWSHYEYASELVLAELLGSWNENNSADRAIINKLTKLDFEFWMNKIRDALSHPESPIVLRNGEWLVTERKKLWTVLGPRLFDDILDRFKECAIAVLSEIDPKFDLPTEKRFAASIFGKALQNSHSLRQGLAESLALLGCFPAALTNSSTGKPKETVLLAIRGIFKKANWALWASLNNLLPILAEADPDQFLRTIEDALSRKSCIFDDLFLQESKDRMGTSYLTGTLWALERLAWEEQFFVRSCVALAELAARDPGGDLSNRPANSLTKIFLPWRPQTNASIDKRKVAIKTLQKEQSAIGWTLLLSLLPNKHRTSSGSSKPTWRQVDTQDKEITVGEYWQQVSNYANLAIDMAGYNTIRLCELIDCLTSLPLESFNKLLRRLSSKQLKSKPKGDQLRLWQSIDKLILKHKRFTGSNWALAPALVLEIEKIAKSFAPSDPIDVHQKLFSKDDFLLYDATGSWDEKMGKLEIRREQAIKEILKDSGVQGVIKFAELVDDPFKVGNSFGRVADAKADKIILPVLLETDIKALMQFSNGYIYRRCLKDGWEWVDRIKLTEWTINQIAQFFAYLPFSPEAWNRARTILQDAEKEYWARVHVNPYGTNDDLGIAIDKLTEFGRYNNAISCLSKNISNNRTLDKVRSASVLLAAAKTQSLDGQVDPYQVIDIIKALQDDPETDPAILSQIEWAYLPYLNEDYSVAPKLLENRLASDPIFFGEVIQYVYLSKNEIESEKKLSEQERSVGIYVWKLIHNWHTPPGTQDDGTFSGNRFKQWLNEVKKLCRKTGHLEVALTRIGHVLFYAPSDDAGKLWINRTAAEVLNGRSEEKMRNGFYLEIINSRGVHEIDPTGKPERDLAEHWRQKAEEIENAGFQRFATVLRTVAGNYDREAEDIVRRYSITGN